MTSDGTAAIHLHKSGQNIHIYISNTLLNSIEIDVKTERHIRWAHICIIMTYKNIYKKHIFLDLKTYEIVWNFHSHFDAPIQWSNRHQINF